jgi:hypothetical protein
MKLKRPSRQDVGYLQRIANGERMCEIAHRDGITYRCLSSRLERVRYRLGIASISHLIATAIWEGWVSREPRKEIEQL